MALFEIDTEICARDGICAAACPASLIREGEDGLPVARDGCEEHCIVCGHCVAACPSGAMSHALVADDDLVEIDRSLEISEAALEQFFKTRRSIRAYKDKKLPRETIGKLLDIAAYAPSGHNLQPVEWSVVDGRERVEAMLDEVVIPWMRSEVEAKTELAKLLNLSGATRAHKKGKDVICRGAPHVVCAHVPSGAGITPFYDGIIALAHLELAAHGMGLGACWAGYLGFAAKAPGMKEFLGIPEHREPAYFILLGEPAFRYRMIPSRKKPQVSWV
jgi:nitroreductase/NAD-dependent dihydropyrimidine dehydrogenase PreA subunit